MPVRSHIYSLIDWIPYRAIPTLEGYLLSIVLSVWPWPIEPTKGCGNPAKLRNVHDNSWRHDTIVVLGGVVAYGSFLVILFHPSFFMYVSCSAGKPIIYDPCICARLRYAKPQASTANTTHLVRGLPFGPSTPSHLVLSGLEGNYFKVPTAICSRMNLVWMNIWICCPQLHRSVMYSTFSANFDTTDASREKSATPITAPRPKRNQVARACDWCRLNRVRCDDKQPCHNCLNRGGTCSNTRPQEATSLPAANR